MDVVWLTDALRSSGTLGAGDAVQELQYDATFVRRGEGDKFRRLLLRGTKKSLASIFAKELESHEAAFYQHVVPLTMITGLRTPHVLFLGEKILLLEDVGGDQWDLHDMNEEPFVQDGCTISGADHLESRALCLVATYAKLHAATWANKPLAANASHSGVSLARCPPVLSSWRRVVAETWICHAIRAAVDGGALSQCVAEFCLLVIPLWSDCEASLRSGVGCVLHGDPHGGNALDIGDATPCLVDFEAASFGHPSWDLSILLLQLWASSWAASPVSVTALLAEAYVAELTAKGVEGYNVESCMADLGICIPLCFVGKIAQRTAEVFDEWWWREADSDGFPGVGHGSVVFAAEAQFLELALTGPSGDMVRAGLPLRPLDPPTGLVTEESEAWCDCFQHDIQF